MKWPWQKQPDPKDARIAELELQIFNVRRYLLPMRTWSDIDQHTKGHVEMMLHITDPNRSEVR